MDQGDELGAGLEAGEAERAEAEAAAEAASGPPARDLRSPGVTPPSEQAERADAPLRIPAADAGPSSPICPFLRLDRDAGMSRPAAIVDVDHHCVALGTPVPVSEAQQSLVCLVTAHVDCPRYLRGSHLVPVAEAPTRRAIPRPTIAAAAVLALSLAGTLAFTAANDGLAIPTASPTPAASGAMVGTPGPATPAAPTPAASIAASPSPSAATAVSPASPSLAVSPAAPASSAPSAAPSAEHSAGTGPTADRLALLQPCPGRTDCYVYVVRAGDNLTSIGLFFGVPFDTLLRLNPWIRDPTTIHKGEQIVLTTPTR